MSNPERPQDDEPGKLFDLDGSEGVTESERILTTLCRKSFLRLWAHGNIYTDEGFRNGKGSTKELCDAVVVFGKDVLLFSDKHITFQLGKPVEVAWPRWFKRAVLASTKQLFGARNWLLRFPERAFLDAACTRRLPVPVPTGDDVRFHLIAVTRGTRDAALAAKGGEGLGSLAINTDIVGNSHLEVPFTVGQPEPTRGFVHVFDEVTVELLMRELDTASDFIDYLRERERVLARPGATLIANGEEDLLALYLQTMDETEKHRLIDEPDGQPQPDVVVVNGELFRTLQDNPAYKRKIEADRISYEWDRLVDRFIQLGDPTLHKEFLEQNAATTEQGLRLLAAEGRFRRRQLSETLIAALRKVEPGARIGRVVYSGVENESVFVFLVVAKREAESYDEYRAHRVALLHAYCRIAKLQAPLGTVFVGLGFDNPHKTYRGGSEDLFVYSQDTWSDADMRELEKKRDELRILGPNTQMSRYRDNEFPIASERPSEQPRSERVKQNSSNVARREKLKKKMQRMSKRRNRK